VDTYDEIPYDSTPFTDTHPENLQALGRLFGLDCPPPAQARVLELGGARGGNLIPIAFYHPGCECTGIDLSARQVADGRALAAPLNLPNLRLEQADILALGEAWGRFDYIVCHGVYSWAPAPVRDAIMALAARLLNPAGLLYVSHNMLPGWRMRGTLRDILLLHTGALDSPAAKLDAARDFLAAYLDSMQGTQAAAARYLSEEAAYLLQAHPSYLYHEYLETINEPSLFLDFAAHAGRHGMQYVCDAELGTMFAGTLPDAAAAYVSRQPDLLQQQQYGDFFRNRKFRKSILCRADAALSREIDLALLDGMAAHALLTPPPKVDWRRAKAQEYRLPDGQKAQVSHPLTKAALAVLAERYPDAIALPELLAAARGLLLRQGAAPALAAEESHFHGELFSLYANLALRLTATAKAFPQPDLQHPRAHALARAQAASGWGHAATPRHGTVQLDAFGAALLAGLDGRRTPDELAADLTARIGNGELALPGAARDARRLAQEAAVNTRRLLQLFARHGLLL
jgi:SAM-dependent methyltransferase/methyltransferase-like protein